MKQREMRDCVTPIIPDSATLHPGYAGCIVSTLAELIGGETNGDTIVKNSKWVYLSASSDESSNCLMDMDG